jgi:hypothetical protein
VSSSISAGEHATAHQSSGAHGDPVSEERTAPHHAQYFAVLLGTFLGGLTLWLLLKKGRGRNGTFSAWRLRGSPPATVFNLPRGLTLPLLQVFCL